MHDDDPGAARRGGGIPLPGPRPAAPRPAAPRPATDAVADPAAAPDPAPVGPREGSTGDAAVDGALARLGELDGLPVRDHVAVLDAVHAALQDRLADVED